MKVLFVVPYPTGVAASQRFRVEQFFPELNKEKIGYDIAPFWDRNTWKILYKQGYKADKLWGVIKGFVSRMLLLRKLSDYDFVFVHRETTPVGFPWFEWLVSKVFKKRMIYDIDDALWLPNTTDSNMIVSKFKQHHKVKQLMKWSYRISCGNNYLAQVAATFNQNCVLLPTTVDTNNYHNRLKVQQTGKVVIGWTGSHSTLPYLREIIPVLEKLEKEFDFDFVLIADKQPDFRLRSLIYIPWNKETEIQDLLRLDIGVMPLPDTEWSEGKCAFKAIQYMALGIPAVVSAVGANKVVVPDGVAGYLCSSDNDWYLYLKQLIQNSNLRASMGLQGRSWVEANYSVVAHEKTFLGLFT